MIQPFWFVHIDSTCAPLRVGRLVNLEKLYLNGNKIQTVEGLEKCAKLEELHISGQKLDDDQELRFHPGSMEAVGTSLMVLNAG